jgi:NAD(P)-dependent dehydrogenase (short-subunit alcohol dehydrogenase family)
VLITGCSTGIGHAAAHALHRRGWRVFASCRKTQDTARLEAEGLRCLRLDLDDSASITAAVDTVLAESGGRLDALFNNGGFGLAGAAEDLSRDALRAQFETLVFGWAELTNRVLPAMRRQGYGRVVMNSSVLGLVALPYRGAYVAAKHAIEGLTDAWRQELHGSGIHFSLIEPGPILTRFRANSLAAFQQWVDVDASPHHERYRHMLNRLEKEGPAVPFTLGPEAVVAPLLHALESRRPRARYYVTFPTHLFGTLRRLLPTRALDAILRRV